ncbi:MAG: alpha/beta hydrolase, partial [Promethearchaeota archaeon]
MDKKQKAWLAFGILFSLTIIAIGLNGGFETNFGTINVSEITITTADGLNQVGKLYLPDGVDSSNPAPGVLAIHGYNNDKHVQRPHSLELAKRGVVVLAIDCLDHGDSDGEVFVWSTYPLDAYAWLESQPYVNENLTGVVGHSMGAMWAHTVHLFNPQIDVVGYQAFGPENFGGMAPYIAGGTNFIQISSGMEEFGSRDYSMSPAVWKEFCADALYNNTVEAGVDDGSSDFFKTYGDVGAGTAQRYVWLWKTHPGQTHDLTATKEITSYFLQTFGMGTTPDEIKTTYIYAEICGAGGALFLMLSIVPLVTLLLGTSTFGDVKQPMPEMKDSLRTKKWVWWAFASLNFAIGGAVFFFAVDAPDGAILGGNPLNNAFFQNWIIDANNIAEWV